MFLFLVFFSYLITVELNVGEAFECGERGGAAHVQRQRDAVNAHVIHAADKAALHILEAKDGRVLAHFGAQVQVVRLQIKHVVGARRRAVRHVLAVQRETGGVAVAHQVHLVPLAVAHHSAAHAHQTLAAAQVEAELHHSIHKLERNKHKNILTAFYTCFY